MEFEFMTRDTLVPPCVPLPKAALQLPVSSTAKSMYACMLDIALADGMEDMNGFYLSDFLSRNCRRQFPAAT